MVSVSALRPAAAAAAALKQVKPTTEAGGSLCRLEGTRKRVIVC